MQRHSIAPRANWREIAEQNGFLFHHAHGQIYWDESAYYSFSLTEIEEQLEDPAQEIYAMCLELVDEACRDDEILKKLAIPEPYWDMARQSWLKHDKSIYGRFDFSYNGEDPAKLLEFNADTPTSLYESAFFQWLWLEQLFPDLDQFNSIQEKLCDALGAFSGHGLMHFSSVKGTEEDRATVEYVMDCAAQAGVSVKFIYMEDIGIGADGHFLDLEDERINTLFKLYPWEYIWEDAYGHDVINGYRDGLKLVEPPWKMILSNKGILPLLWQRHQGHPNLLPAWFEEETPLAANYVTKPLLGREGASIGLVFQGKLASQTKGIYGKEGYVCQEFCGLPNFDRNYPVCGLWIANGLSCGLGIREDAQLVTGDLSRFVPHVIL